MKTEKQVDDTDRCRVYQYTNKMSGKRYVGYHCIKPGRLWSEDSYDTSSTSFKKILKRYPNDFIYTVIHQGNKGYCQELETMILREGSAANNPEFYNKGENRAPKTTKTKKRK